MIKEGRIFLGTFKNSFHRTDAEGNKTLRRWEGVSLYLVKHEFKDSIEGFTFGQTEDEDGIITDFKSLFLEDTREFKYEDIFNRTRTFNDKRFEELKKSFEVLYYYSEILKKTRESEILKSSMTERQRETDIMQINRRMKLFLDTLWETLEQWQGQRA